jgi:hypothetical protein
METGKSLAQALAETYQAAGKPLSEQFGFTAQPPAAPAQPPAATPAPQAPPPPAAAPVQTAQAEVDALRQQQLDLDRQLLQVQTVSFDTTEGERLLAAKHELNSRLDTANAALILARQSAVVSEQQQVTAQLQQYNNTYDAAFMEIAPAFPGLTQADSAMRAAFEAEMQRAWDNGDAALLNPEDAPLIIARRAARAIHAPAGLPPAGTSPVSSPQPSTPRPPVSFPGILPAGNGSSTAPPASTEVSLAELRASLHAAQTVLGSGRLNAGLEEYGN